MMWAMQGDERGRSEQEGDEIEGTRTKVDGGTSGGQKRTHWEEKRRIGSGEDRRIGGGGVR